MSVDCYQYAFVRTVEPVLEPLSIKKVRRYLRIDEDDDSQDDVLQLLITQARQRCEELTEQCLITQTWELNCEGFFDEFRLKSPLQSVTHVKYLDLDNVLQTLATTVYQVDTKSPVPRIRLAYNQAWPAALPVPNAVRVTFVAGYGLTEATVPERIRQRLLAHVGYCYENRQNVQDDEYLDRLFSSVSLGLTI